MSTNNKIQKQQEDRKVAVERFNKQKSQVFDLLMRNRDQIKQALPSFLSPEVLIRTALTSMIRRPELLECTGHSLLSCVLTSAQLGLRPDDVLGEAYLIPFNNNRMQRKECQFLIGYKGLIALAMRSGQVSSVKPVAVYAANEPDGDYFDYDEGLNERLEHKSVGLIDAARITHFYAIVRFKGGGHVFKVMTRAQVEAVRDQSKNYMYAKDKSTTVWGTRFEEMGCKTVLRRVMKYVPLSPELSHAIAIDEQADTGKQNLSVNFMDENPDTAEEVIGEIMDETEADNQETEEKEKRDQKDNAKQRGDAVTSATADLINQKLNAKDAQ